MGIKNAPIPYPFPLNRGEGYKFWPFLAANTAKKGTKKTPPPYGGRGLGGGWIV